MGIYLDPGKDKYEIADDSEIFVQKTAEKTKSGRTPYLEALRIIAVLYVIFIHTGRRGNFLYLERPVGGPAFWIYMFISIYGQFCVPVFLAVSGAVLLGRDDEPVGSWLKRVFRALIILVVYSFAYYVRDVRKFEELAFSWSYFFTRLYSQVIKYHLWYLYVYIVYLLTLPLLRAMVRGLKDRYFYYVFGAAVVMNGIIPCAEYCLFKGEVTLSSYKSSLWFVINIVLYPCMGYFIHNRMKILPRKRTIAILWIANLAGVIVSCLMTNYYAVVSGTYDESIQAPFYASFVMLNSVAMFITVKAVFESVKLSRLTNTAIISLGKCTFGIYLLHVFFLETPRISDIYEMITSRGVNEMIAAWILCICIFLMCYAATLILSLIPWIRKLVGFK